MTSRFGGAFLEYIDEMKRTRKNDRFLKGVEIPASIRLASDRREAVEGAEVVVLAPPSKYFTSVVSGFKGLVSPGTLVVSITKGLCEKTNRRMTELGEEILGTGPIVALAGPTHAEEVARGIPTAIVAACADETRAKRVQEIWSGPLFRVYTSTDPVGVEIGGAVKDVLAIAVGCSDGMGYGYDAAGRIVSRRYALGTNRFDRAYAYDGLDRLVSDGGASYAYDAAGNRTAKRGDDGGDIAYALGAGDRLAAWTGGVYEHDAAGCVMHIVRGADTWDLTWNWRYQLVSVATNGAFAESYSYDALGRRVSTVSAEGTERHVYDENWQVIADIDGDGNVIRSYEWGAGIDQLLAVRIGSRTYTALTDIQGTVWGYADGSGAVVARWTYDAWGNVLSEEIADGAEELRSVRYRFHGRERSAATGLVNFRMRWYDPVTGRWLSKDPIRLRGGLNLYAFCHGRPLTDMDHYGLCDGDGAWSNKMVDAGVMTATAGGLLISMSGQLPPLPPQVEGAMVAGCWIGGGALVFIGSIMVAIGAW